MCIIDKGKNRLNRMQTDIAYNRLISPTIIYFTLKKWKSGILNMTSMPWNEKWWNSRYQSNNCPKKSLYKHIILWLDVISDINPWFAHLNLYTYQWQINSWRKKKKLLFNEHSEQTANHNRLAIIKICANICESKDLTMVCTTQLCTILCF